MHEIGKLEGLRAGGRNVNCIRYAGETFLTVNTNQKLRECRRTALGIKFANIEVMGSTKGTGRVNM